LACTDIYLFVLISNSLQHSREHLTFNPYPANVENRVSS
jgi:hypothetical protein